VEARSRRPLPELRAWTIGATDPRDAVPGSIKRALLDEHEELGLAQVCTRRNCIHISPSVIEAMAALRRYFSTPEEAISVADTAFGARLGRAGCSATQLDELAANPDVDLRGLTGPLFEVTEDMGVDEAFDFAVALLGERR
jgi:hypothetical protein